MKALDLFKQRVQASSGAKLPDYSFNADQSPYVESKGLGPFNKQVKEAQNVPLYFKIRSSSESER